jgi:hypothetical protein
LAELVEHTGEKRNTCRILKAKLEGKTPLGILTCERKVSIRIYLKEIGLKSVVTGLIWFRTGRSGGILYENRNELSGFIKYGDYHA